MKTLKEILARMLELRGVIDELVAKDESEDGLSDEERSQFDEYLSEWDTLDEERKPLEERAQRLERIRSADLTREPIDGARTQRVADPTERRYEDIDVQRAGRTELRDAALALLEDEVRSTYDLPTEAVDQVEKLLKRGRSQHFDSSLLAQRMLLTENEHYRSAFMKGVTQASPAFTPEEARAVNDFREWEARAMSVGLTTQGGFGVPVLLDPSIILTSGASDAPVLDLARVESVNTNIWKGVSSAAVAWSFDAEQAAVSDDSPTLAQPTIDVHMARGFIPFSIEVGQDYPNFASEMSGLLNQGYIDLIAVKTISGGGSGEPWGIFADLAAGSAVVPVTTNGQFGAVDVSKTWTALPQRFRGRASWISHTDYQEAVIGFSPAGAGGLYTNNLADSGLAQVRGRPWYLTDYAPAFTGATPGTTQHLVVGDFSNYLVAVRAGTTIELVPHLVDVTANRPTGQRGWFAWNRIGGGSINDNGFRLLKNS